MRTEDILQALRRIMRAADRRSKQLEREFRLTVPQLLVLRLLKERGELSVGEIASGIRLSQATITSILQRLLARGFVSKKRSETDRRRINVRLTERGRAELEAAPSPLQSTFVERCEALEDWERSLLTASVQRIAALMDAEEDVAPILDSGEFEQTGSAGRQAPDGA